jgi:hypothetical protein
MQKHMHAHSEHFEDKKKIIRKKNVPLTDEEQK